MRRIFQIALFAALTFAVPEAALAQPAARAVPVDQPDAQRTRSQLSELLGHYPPTLRDVLALDHSLLSNQPYLAPYPALTEFLTSHPEVLRNPGYYIGEHPSDDRRSPTPADIWSSVLSGLGVFLGFGMAIGVATWLVRTILDYRRWNRLSKVQQEVHTRILDRFTANDELLSYIQSPAGAKFLQSSPIALDAAPRAMGAPLSRILWSVQAGLVLAASGAGLEMVSAKFAGDAAQPFEVLGYLGIALGIGFVTSAAISFSISHKLGLIEPPVRTARLESPDAR
ncbi:MAG: hypothetical protein KGN84_05410 [Acidobacteriota bacterium]|nr:hypothetical protein [Acidobacteriota bacterium]